jgi:hypothetical protein
VDASDLSRLLAGGGPDPAAAADVLARHAGTVAELAALWEIGDDEEPAGAFDPAWDEGA